MIRICFGTAAQWTAVRKNGHWSVEGISSAPVAEMLDYFERTASPYNISLFKPIETNDCIQRLIKNESDVSYNDIPIDTISPEYHAPEPSFAGKFKFFTGYIIPEEQENGDETATVLENVNLLQPEVYYIALSLLSCFISFIILRICIHHPHCPLKRNVNLIGREIGRIFHHTSEHFKLINLLFSVLIFYMITSFLCVYKTSHVVLERPFYPRTYEESLNHETSIAHLVDEMAVVSEGFKNAPVNSIKGRIWKKLLASGKKDLFTPKQVDTAAMGTLIDALRVELTRSSIIVESPLMVNILRTSICSISRDGELFVMKFLADPIERDTIFGPAMRKRSILMPYFASRFKRTFETKNMEVLWSRVLDVSALVLPVIGASASHQWRQKVLCDDENAFAPEPAVNSIPLKYFNSFFIACSWMWALATVVHVVQSVWYMITVHGKGCSLRYSHRFHKSRINHHVYH